MRIVCLIKKKLQRVIFFLNTPDKRRGKLSVFVLTNDFLELIFLCFSLNSHFNKEVNEKLHTLKNMISKIVNICGHYNFLKENI